jgi:hypothetical protein
MMDRNVLEHGSTGLRWVLIRKDSCYVGKLIALRQEKVELILQVVLFY